MRKCFTFLQKIENVYFGGNGNQELAAALRASSSFAPKRSPILRVTGANLHDGAVRRVRGSDSVYLMPERESRQRESEPIFARTLCADLPGIRRKCNRVTRCVPRWGSDSVYLSKKRKKDRCGCAALSFFLFLEQATGIEPAASAWEAEVLPLDYACEHGYYIPNPCICQSPKLIFYRHVSHKKAECRSTLLNLFSVELKPALRST